MSLSQITKNVIPFIKRKNFTGYYTLKVRSNHKQKRIFIQLFPKLSVSSHLLFIQLNSIIQEKALKHFFVRLIAEFHKMFRMSEEK